MREKVGKLYNKDKKSNLRKDWGAYKEWKWKFKYVIRKTKRQSWKKYCESITETSEAYGLRKVHSKEACTPSFITGQNGSWVEDSQETLDILTSTHFPGCSEQVDEEDNSAIRTFNWWTVNTVICKKKIICAIGSFLPYKSPGPDDIRLIMMVRIYKSMATGYLQMLHVPRMWRETNVTFIPKAGSVYHILAKV